MVNIPSNKNALKRGFRDNTVDAINFIYRALDGRFRYAEIEEMKVRDILDLLDEKKGPDKTENKKEAGTIENKADELLEDDPDLVLAKAELVIDK